MKRYRRLLLALGILSLSAIARAEDSLVAQAQTGIRPSTTIAVAESAQIEIELSANRKLELSTFTAIVPEELKVLKSELIPFKNAEDGRWKARIVLDFLALSEGAVTFPAQSVPYRSESGEAGNLQSPPLSIAVKNSQEGPVSPELLRDIKGPVQVPNYFFWIALTVLLGSAAAAWFYFKRRKPEAAEPLAPREPERPLDETILEKLDAAKAEYEKTGDARAFYIRISDIFREYLGKRYGFESLERTTSEIFTEMKKAGAERAVSFESKEILAGCDLVKFAKYSPSEKEAGTDWERIRGFVQKTTGGAPDEGTMPR